MRFFIGKNMQLTQLQQRRLDRLYYVIVSDEWDEAKHPRKKNGQFGKGGSKSAMKSVKANIKRGRQAMNTTIAEKRTVHRAMYQQELGWVDFEWGDDGLTKARNKKGEPIGKGISHIIEARMRKDGMSYEQATKMLTKNIVETIAKGKIHKEWRSPDGKHKSLQIDHQGYRVGLAKSKGNNSWIVTGFKLHSTGVNGVGGDTSATTHIKPTLTRQNVGAVETKQIISLNPNQIQRLDQLFRGTK